MQVAGRMACSSYIVQHVRLSVDIWVINVADLGEYSRKILRKEPFAQNVSLTTILQSRSFRSRYLPLFI